MSRLLQPGPLIGIFVGLLVVVAIVATIVAPSPTTLDPNTPEGVVQQYLEAALDGDEAAAEALLAEETDLDCPSSSSARISLVESTITDDRATVEVRITESNVGPFDGGSYTRTEVFRLERTAEGWRITDWPWSFCWLRPERP